MAFSTNIMDQIFFGQKKMVVSTNVDLSLPMFVLVSKGIRSKQDILFARGLIVNTLAVLKGITQKLRLQTSDSDPENLCPVQRHEEPQAVKFLSRNLIS